MVRTLGSRDIGRRRPRSDLGKPRKKYAGKKVKGNRRRQNGKIVYYPRVSKRKTVLKLYCWKIEKMSVEGLRKFPYQLRRHIVKTVYGRGSGRIRIDASVYDIDTKEKIEDYCARNLWEGLWLIMGFSHKKNKYHVSPVKMFRVRIKETPHGLKGRMLRSYAFRRWWWQG